MKAASLVDSLRNIEANEPLLISYHIPHTYRPFHIFADLIKEEKNIQSNPPFNLQKEALENLYRALYLIKKQVIFEKEFSNGLVVLAAFTDQIKGFWILYPKEKITVKEFYIDYRFHVPGKILFMPLKT